MIELLISAMLSLIFAAQSPDVTLEQKNATLKTTEIVLGYVAQEQERLNLKIQNECGSSFEAQPINSSNTQTTMEIKKELEVYTTNFLTNQNGLYYDVYVFYTEDGVEKEDVVVTITSDDKGTFVGDGVRAIKIKKQITHKGVIDRTGVHFQYEPELTGERTFTVKAGEVTKEVKARGANEKE